MARVRVADFIAQFISDDLGITDVFMLSGAGIMHLTDGLACNTRIRSICLQHEQAASMALEAYARSNEDFGVGYFSTGPGALNALTGLGGAWQDSVPCLFISGQVKRSETTYAAGVPQLRQFGVQELNMMPIVTPLCKYAVHLDAPEQVRFELEKSVSIARQGRPGPVWMEIPLDVQAAMIDTDLLPRYTDEYQLPIASARDLASVAAAIASASRPVIVAGRGVRLAGAQRLLEQLAVRYQIPVVTPYLGIDNLRHSSPVFVGKTGVKGDRAANLAMQNADFLLAIGTSLHVSVVGYEYEHFAREAKKFVVDIDLSSHMKKTIEIDSLIQSDAAAFLSGILALEPPRASTDRGAWLSTCKRWASRYSVCEPGYSETPSAINMYTFVDRLSDLAEEGDTFIADAGSAFYTVSQGIKLLKANQRYIPSGAMATMGYSLPAAIGVCAASRGSRVLAITGDGSLQQNIQELATLAQYGFPVKLFVFNNDGYLSIRASQRNYFEGRFIGESDQSGVGMPDAVKIAEAYGIAASRVSDVRDLDDAICMALQTSGPYLLDVVTPRDQPVIPTVGTRLNPDGSMSSRPLEDMVPFLSRDEYRSNMLIEPID